MSFYIGLDVHAKTTTAVVVDQSGEQKLRKTFETTESQLIQFISQVPGKKHLTFEEGTLSQWLYLTLVEQVDELWTYPEKMDT